MRVSCDGEAFDLDMGLQLDERFDLLRQKFGHREINLSPTLSIKLDNDDIESLAVYFKTEGLGAWTFTFADGKDKIGVASRDTHSASNYYCLLCSDWYRCKHYVKSDKHEYKATIAGGTYEFTEQLSMGYDDSESRIVRIGNEWLSIDENDDRGYSVTTDIQASDVELLKKFFFDDVVKYY